MEYGFKGKLKVVVKRVYPDPEMQGDTIRPNKDEAISTYTYFFNPGGNIDSAQTEYTYPSGKSYSYRTIFKFDSSRKSGWVAIDGAGEKLLTGEIKWISNKEFTEKVSDASGVPKYETTSILNDSFRVIKTKIKAFDLLSNTVQDDVQEFELDEQQNAIHYKTTHQDSGQTELTDYKYLKVTSLGNPAELFIIERDTGAKTFVRLEYVYY